MAYAFVEIDGTEFYEYIEKFQNAGADTEKAINEVLHGEGAQIVKESIARLLPESGRKWKGKGRSAKAAMPGAFTQEDENLVVKISAKGKYGYLYFPDDGSNTRKHRGNQQFMKKGAENARDKISELIIGKLTEQFDKGE